MRVGAIGCLVGLLLPLLTQEPRPSRVAIATGIEELQIGNEHGDLEQTFAERVTPALPIVAVASLEGQYITCGGVFVRPSWILTAAHCTNLGGRRTGVAVWSAPARSAAVLAFVQYAINAEQGDVALLRIESVSERPAPLGLVGEDPRVYVGRTARMRVFGAGSERGRSWVGERIVEVTASEMKGQVVSPSGPCVGDSGSPLVVEDETGKARVVGVLSRGSISCKQTDMFERVDVLAPWIARTVAGPTVDDGNWASGPHGNSDPTGFIRSCSNVGVAGGKCLLPGGGRVYCEKGSLATTDAARCLSQLTRTGDAALACALGFAESL